MGQDSTTRPDVAALLMAAVLLIGVAATCLYSYLLFHSLVEAFSVIVACGVFMVVWNARPFLDNNYLLFVGIGFVVLWWFEERQIAPSNDVAPRGGAAGGAPGGQPPSA